MLARLRRTWDRLTHGGLDPERPFSLQVYDEPLSDLDLNEIVRSLVTSFQEAAEAGQETSYVRGTIETFVLCHELAHVALRHCDTVRGWGPRRRWSRRQRLERNAVLQQAEHLADALALEMTGYGADRSAPACTG